MAGVQAVAAALQVLTQQNTQRQKVEVNEIAEKGEYDTWIYQFRGELDRIGLLAIVDAALVPGAPIPLQAGHAALNQEETVLYNKVSSALRNNLRGTTLQLASGRQCSCVVEILRVLVEHWGTTQAIDQQTVLTSFNEASYTHETGDLKLGGIIWLVGIVEKLVIVAQVLLIFFVD